MNLRNIGQKCIAYNIGLDLGTGSVGWAVTDSHGKLLRFKGKPTWGSRLFPDALPASVARTARGQRRRYDRRRQRLDLLQGFFCDAMQETDPEFFIRLNQARLLKEDRAPDHSEYRYPLFNDVALTDVEYYKRFPTIYHLRKYLMESAKKEDLRLVYLALHNIVKHRGNFLWQENPGLSARNANVDTALDRLCSAIDEWCDGHDLVTDQEPDRIQISEVLARMTGRGTKSPQIRAALGLGKANSKMANAISRAMLGYVIEFGDIFGEEEKKDGSKFSLDNDGKVEEYRALCPDEGVELFESLLMIRSAVILMSILEGSDGRTISYHKCDEYERYAQDLKTLKALVRAYLPEKYDEVFRGEHYDNPLWKKDYDPSKAKGYTRYNLNRGQGYDEFKKYVVKLFAHTNAVEDPRYVDMMASFDEERFLRRLKTSDNGSIPYQLHLEEMHAILQKQGKFYPFLLEEQGKIESLVTFRIPYYVGPLTQKNAPVDATGKTRFAWSERVEGEKGRQPIRPWNWDEIIDKDKSAEAFIRRMTGTCTYIYGEPVLPKSSLLYERFCVLNELNGARYCIDGDRWRRFSFSEREAIMEELFERGRSVSYKAVANWLRRRNPGLSPRVRGGQGETGFESKLSSYGFFCKLLGVDELSDSMSRMVEEIILWNTLFEDRDILRERLNKTYGKYGSRVLSGEQIGKICKKRFVGWGRLSKRLLCDVRVKFDGRRLSIMDIMEEGIPYGCHMGSALVFMEVLHDDVLGFQEIIDEINKSSVLSGGIPSVEDMPGSPALRRSVNQALRIVEEIVKIAGTEPANIYIETTRDDDERRKRTRTTRRYDQIFAAINAFGAENDLSAGILGQLKEYRGQEISDRLALYFLQNGKCMYSGKPLDIRNLSTYQIDHIIPQSYIKDDSLENKVLVLPSMNQSKSDSLLVDGAIRRKMWKEWRALHRAGMIGDKKFRNLTRSEISDQQMKGFVARQLVETSQIVKFVRLILEETYPSTRIRSIKASLSHQLREAEGYVKCREANDYHHAHDALLVCELGRFIQLRYGDLFDNPVGLEHAMRAYIKTLDEERRQTGRMPGNAGMIVGTFRRDYVDRDTGEILWEGCVETQKIRTYLNYRDCFITRMLDITSGAYWKQNAISPKTSKPPRLPLKGNLDPKKYGGFTGEEYAYFFVARVRKGRKERIAFMQMPVSVASTIRTSDMSALEEYARVCAEERGMVFIRIERACVPKYQLIEIDGERFYITGKKEMRNGKQLAFSQEEIRLLQVMSAGIDPNRSLDDESRLNGVGQEVFIKFFDSMLAKCNLYARRLMVQMKLGDLHAGFADASAEDKARSVLAVLCISNAGSNVADLAAIGGKKQAGRLQPTYDKELNVGNGHFVFIDQSITGMFERRCEIEL